MKLNRIQLQLRDDLVRVAADMLKNEYKDYKLSNQDIADIMGISRQAVHLKLSYKKLTKKDE